MTKIKSNTTYLCVHVNKIQLCEKLQVMWLSAGIIQTLIMLLGHRFPFFKTNPQSKQKILAGILMYFVSCCLCFRIYESEPSLPWQKLQRCLDSSLSIIFPKIEGWNLIQKCIDRKLSVYEFVCSRFHSLFHLQHIHCMGLVLVFFFLLWWTLYLHSLFFEIDLLSYVLTSNDHRYFWRDWSVTYLCYTSLAKS